MDDCRRRARVRWRCRRGMRELDVLFERYFEAGWNDTSEAQRAAFERLLELPDPLLLDWVVMGTPAPRALEEIVERVRTYAPTVPA